MNRGLKQLRGRGYFRLATRSTGHAPHFDRIRLNPTESGLKIKEICDNSCNSRERLSPFPFPSVVKSFPPPSCVRNPLSFNAGRPVVPGRAASECTTGSQFNQFKDGEGPPLDLGLWTLNFELWTV